MTPVNELYNMVRSSIQNFQYQEGYFMVNNSVKLIAIMFIVLVTNCFLFCNVGNANTNSSAENFTIYPTTNYFTQLELDTRDGRIWQVHIALKEDEAAGKFVINSLPLTDSPEPGRFILSPTGNMYNFILLDTIDGRAWQVQWSFKKENRGIIALGTL